MTNSEIAAMALSEFVKARGERPSRVSASISDRKSMKRRGVLLDPEQPIESELPAKMAELAQATSAATIFAPLGLPQATEWAQRLDTEAVSLRLVRQHDPHRGALLTRVDVLCGPNA